MVTYVVLAKFTDQGIRSLSLSLSALGNVRTETLRAFSAAEMTQVLGKML